MNSLAFSAEDWEVSSRVWRFGACEFDESSRELRLSGRTVELESKPLEVLYRLLLHAGEVVTKEELFEEPASAAGRAIRVSLRTMPPFPPAHW